MQHNRRTIAVHFVLLLALGACDAADTRTTIPVKTDKGCVGKAVHLTVVGDSLARGWGAQHQENTFAALAYSFVRKWHPGTFLENLGIPGATTDEVATREVPRVRSAACSLTIVISGANDVQKYYTPSHIRRSYSDLLRKIRARQPNSAVIVMGLPDVALSSRIPWITKPVISALSQNADASIAAVARQYGAASVPLYEESRRYAQSAGSVIGADGLHPNDRGYRLMARQAYPVINAVLK